jgi:hypothetical protein
MEAVNIFDQLSAIESFQPFAEGGIWKPGLPLLKVTGVGDVRFPIDHNIVSAMGNYSEEYIPRLFNDAGSGKGHLVRTYWI